MLEQFQMILQGMADMEGRLNKQIQQTKEEMRQEIKQSEEYINYKMAKEALNLNPDLKKQIDEFEAARYEAQVTAMQTGKNDEEKTKKMR